MIFLFKNELSLHQGFDLYQKKQTFPWWLKWLHPETKQTWPLCVVKVGQISDNITTTSEYKIAWCWRFLSPLQGTENGYGIRVSGATVSQHWGNTFSSEYILYISCTAFCLYWEDISSVSNLLCLVSPMNPHTPRWCLRWTSTLSEMLPE